jgi:hypothetical protein
MPTGPCGLERRNSSCGASEGIVGGEACAEGGIVAKGAAVGVGATGCKAAGPPVLFPWAATASPHCPISLFTSSKCPLSSFADCLSATTSGLFVMEASAAITPRPRSTKCKFWPIVCMCCRMRSSRHAGGLAEATPAGCAACCPEACSNVLTFSISCRALCSMDRMRGSRRSIASLGAGEPVGRGGSPKVGGMNGRASMGCCACTGSVWLL